MAARKASQPEKFAPSEMVAAGRLDLSIEGMERARLFQEGTTEWTLLSQAWSTRRQAEAQADRWRSAEPESFGSTNKKFACEVVKLVPREWWKGSKPPVVRFGLQVRLIPLDENTDYAVQPEEASSDE